MFFEDAYNEGKKNEDEHFIFLQEYFNDPTLKQTKKIYSTFDYNSDNIIIELKKRNFDFGKYEDYMIGLNKIKRAQKAKKDIFFIIEIKYNSIHKRYILKYKANIMCLFYIFSLLYIQYRVK